MNKSHLPKDPKQWVKELESIWQAMDSEKAAEGFTDDVFMVYGCNQRQSGEALLKRPGEWFSYAKDLKITKNYIAHGEDCIVASWNSTYTDPNTKEKVHERGIEFFRFRDGKVCEQHAWQHSWEDGKKPDDSGISTS